MADRAPVSFKTRGGGGLRVSHTWTGPDPPPRCAQEAPLLAPFSHVYPSLTTLCGQVVRANHHIPEMVHFLGFSTSPPSCWKGGSSTRFAPFRHPLCTPLSALQTPFCALFAHPLCAGTPFLHHFCGGGGGFCAKAFCKKGTKCINKAHVWFLKSTCSAFFFSPLWPRQGQAFAGPLSVVTPRQGSPCSTHGETTS